MAQGSVHFSVSAAFFNRKLTPSEQITLAHYFEREANYQLT